MSQKVVTILIVDDDPVKHELLHAFLAPSGYTLTSAWDGEEGLVKAKEQRPDVIVADMIMRGMDGYDFCQQLQADPTLKDIPVVAYTMMDFDKMRTLSKACHIEYVIPLASEAEEVTDIIEAALAGKPDPLAFRTLRSLDRLEDIVAELKQRSAALPEEGGT